MKNLYKSILIIALAFGATSCFNKEKPNYQFFADMDMYESPSYETYGEYEIFPGEQSAQDPAENTIPRGWEVYPYPNNNDGKQAATDSLKNPLPYTESNVEKGGHLYDIYCAICHGADGDGSGPLVEREKFLGVPGFADSNRDITEGDIYHVMYYGLNNMGSYAHQTTTKERWQITHYITQLQDELNDNEERAFEEDSLQYNFDKEYDPAAELGMGQSEKN